jgi:hypothetical protein
MKIRIALAAAVVAVLAGCGGGQATMHRAAQSPSPIAVASAAPVYSNVLPCWAFHRATTKGVPASAAGEDTLTWLQSQTIDAYPMLRAAIQRFVNAWNNPADVTRINNATRVVEHLCHLRGSTAQ